MYKLEAKLRITCHADISEECAATSSAREAELYSRLRELLDRGTIRDAFAAAGFDILYIDVSSVGVEST